jgi:predicted nucleotidyltransferase
MRSGRERERVRERLLDLAAADPDIAGAAITGSLALDAGDEWSDIDLAFAVSDELGPTLERWTEHLSRDFDAVHHWDLPFGATVYRVFLLPGWLEVDIAFAPAAEFGPRGPTWRTVFGEAVELPPAPAQSADDLLGRAWHHALHARACIERGRPWQAEHWIRAVRDQVLASACLRLGHPTRYAKGADLLPAELTAPLEAALVRSLDEAELRRALAVAGAALAAEVERSAPALDARLAPMLRALTTPGPSDHPVSRLGIAAAPSGRTTPGG